jgi:hypothetical protein
MITPRCFSRRALVFAASLSSIPLKGSYTAITEQLWRQREQAKNRGVSGSALDQSAARGLSPKLQVDTVVVYDFPGDPKLKDEYSNPWGDVRFALEACNAGLGCLGHYAAYFAAAHR